MPDSLMMWTGFFIMFVTVLWNDISILSFVSEWNKITSGRTSKKVWESILGHKLEDLQ